MTAGPSIDYESLAQEAMRGVVRTVLTRAAKSGLPGDHHFYISFDTETAGVILSKRLRERYPHEMTIVLQHRFWDLSVTDERFEVKLTFDGIPERLVVPFSAIKVFFDPSVRYGLQFEDPNQGTETGAQDATLDDTVRGRAGATRGPRKPRPRRPKGEKEAASPGAEKPVPGTRAPPGAPAAGGAVGASPAVPDTPEAEPAASRGAEIVSLDAFRKK